MNCETCRNYLMESERTERKFPNGLKIEGDTAAMLIRLMRSTELLGLIIDNFKKVVIYDKPLHQIEKTVMGLTEAMFGILSDETSIRDLEINEASRAEILHAILGIVTESSEIIPILMKYALGDQCDVKHLSEEIGDFFWYLSIVERIFGLDMTEIKQRNISKLKARYPDKFSAEYALNRDLEAERQAMT